MFLFAWLPENEWAKTVFVRLRPSVFSDFLKYNLPDTLWFLSGIALLRFIWFCRLKEQKVYVSCFYATGAVFEISQLSEKVPGTFDIPDLIFMGLTAFIEGLLYKNFVLKKGA